MGRSTQPELHPSAPSTTRTPPARGSNMRTAGRADMADTPTEPSLRARARSSSRRPTDVADDSRRGPRPYLLNPDRLGDHIDRLYRAAWALCGSRHDAEDLVQETLSFVLKRPRLIRDDNEIGYLLRALRNTHTNRYRAAARRPATRQLLEDDASTSYESRVNSREIMEAIASAPAPYRDAVIAVDLLGLSYREAARCLRTREGTITTRLHRGRQHVARELSNETMSAS
jgi:RNA polymerase sigma-70 factor, ECF subfamily